MFNYVEYHRQYREKNQELLKEKAKQYHKDNKEKIAERQRQYNIDHPESNKKRYLLHRKESLEYSRQYSFRGKYKLSKKDWEGLWYAQDGRCAICDKFFTNLKDTHVDHNHKTNKTRSLLCNKCNLGIGFFNDDPELLKIARRYLIMAW